MMRFNDDLRLRRLSCFTLKYISESLGVGAQVAYKRSDIARQARSLTHMDSKRYLRGHWEAWFFVRFVSSCLNVLNRLAKESGGRAFVKTNLHEGNFLEVLGPRMQAPHSLSAFLNRLTG